MSDEAWSLERDPASGWILCGQHISGNPLELYAHDLVGDGILSPDGHVLP